jgi:hypothetical protein
LTADVDGALSVLFLFDVTRSVTMMTPAASVCFVGSEFDDFLYAPIGVERNEMLLSVLSAFARLNVDPWREAAELSELPKQTATHRLTSLIARLPSGRWAHADCGVIADRLIELLPHRSASKVPLAKAAHSLPEWSHSTIVKILFCVALAATALIFAASSEPSSRVGHVDVPVFGTASPSPSPPQSQ